MKKFRDVIDKRYLKVCVYAGVTALLVILICVLAYCSRGFWAGFGRILAAVLEPLITGLILAYILMPVTNFFGRKLSRGRETGPAATASRALAVLITLILVFGVLAAIIVILFVTINKQLSGFSWDGLKEMFQDLQIQGQSIMDLVKDFLRDKNVDIEGILSGLASWIPNIANGAKNFFFGLIFAVYFLYDGARIGRYWKKAAHGLFRPEALRRGREFLKDADDAFSGYIRGQVVDALLVGTLAAVILTIFQVPFGIIIGIIMGVGNLIPYFGPILGYASVIILCLLRQDLKALVVGLVIIVILQFVDGNFINPKLLGNTVHVHPLLVIACVIAGGAVGGILGMLIAVPVGALIKKYFEKLVEKARTRRKGSEAGTPES